MVSVIDFDQAESKINLIISSYFFRAYYKKFQGFISSNATFLQDLVIERAENNEKVVNVSFRAKSLSEFNKNTAERLSVILSKFEEISLKKELSKTEFVPLDGYSYDNLSEEIQRCVREKHNICIIKDYDEYLNRKGEYNYHQYIIEYGTQEYYDTVVLVYEKKFDELKSKYSNKLVLESWIIK